MLLHQISVASSVIVWSESPNPTLPGMLRCGGLGKTVRPSPRANVAGVRFGPAIWIPDAARRKLP